VTRAFAAEASSVSISIASTTSTPYSLAIRPPPGLPSDSSSAFSSVMPVSGAFRTTIPSSPYSAAVRASLATVLSPSGYARTAS
jgi:hypothetical protein